MTRLALLLLVLGGSTAAAQNPQSSRVVVPATAAVKVLELSAGRASFALQNNGPASARWGDSLSVAAGRGQIIASGGYVSLNDLIPTARVYAKASADSAVFDVNRLPQW